MRYRLAIFDFDGTLADSFPWFRGVMNRLADEHRFRRIEDHEVETLRGHSARQLVEHLRVPAWKLPRIAQGMRKHMAREIGQIALFQDPMVASSRPAGLTVWGFVRVRDTLGLWKWTRSPEFWPASRRKGWSTS
jgi:phosphoglycolate phosphatase